MTVAHNDLPLGAPWACVARPNAGQKQPVLEVRRVDDSTFLLRQGAATSWEAPVLALLIGTRRALLLDTGAVADPSTCPLAQTVTALVNRWCRQHQIASIRPSLTHSP